MITSIVFSVCLVDSLRSMLTHFAQVHVHKYPCIQIYNVSVLVDNYWFNSNKRDSVKTNLLTTVTYYMQLSYNVR